MSAEQRDRILVGTKALFDVQRLPRAFFFVLADTKGELGRMTHRRFGNLLRFGAADVPNHEPYRAANRRVGTKPVAQGVVPTVDADFLADRAVDNREWSSREGGDVNRMRI